MICNYLMLLVLALGIICGEAFLLKRTYKRKEVTNVQIEWDEFRKDYISIKPVKEPGWYSFYQVNAHSEYERVDGLLPHHLGGPLDALTLALPIEITGTATIVCIGLTDDGQMVRTKERSETNLNATAIIIWVVVVVFICAGCGGFCCWFMIQRKKKNQQEQYRGQPQQFQVHQHPMPMTVQVQEAGEPMGNQQYAVPTAPM